MNWIFIWICFLVPQCIVHSSPVQSDAFDTPSIFDQPSNNAGSQEKSHTDEKVISVRITSSVAVARGHNKPVQRSDKKLYEHLSKELHHKPRNNSELLEESKDLSPITEVPTLKHLQGANIDFLKQLQSKETKFLHSPEIETSALRNDREPDEAKDDAISKILSSREFNSFRSKSISILDDALKLSDDRISNDNDTDVEEVSPTENAYLSTAYDDEDDKSTFNPADYKDKDDSFAESSIKNVLEIEKHNDDYDNVPLGRSLDSPSSKNYIQGLIRKPMTERESSTRLTTISFNIVHDPPKTFNNHKPYVNPHYQEQKYYEPTVYSQPSKIYSVPAKIYSEPAKIYSEPAKIYSEPAKIYSEPAKIYSEPAKFYSEPASLHLKPNPRNYSPLSTWSPPTKVTTTVSSSTIESRTEPTSQQTDEKNYEVDEKESVLSNGRSHGVQESTTEKCKQDNCKVGYVVKGRQFNKYRVEERTSDGFIVGEYGVVRNEDGALRGVRYTADSEASPRLIYDALMKFLQLK